jgi:hypothetical protein
MAQPKQAIAAVQQSVTITVDVNNNPVVTPRMLLMSVLDTVQWTNNTGYTIDIKFHGASKSVFNDVIGLVNGTTSAQQSPQSNNVIANYQVTVHEGANSVLSGPNGIEVGTGVLIVNLTYNSTTSAWTSDPSAGIIPLEQTVQFANLDPANSCPVSITATMFNPSSFTISPGSRHSTTAQIGQSGTATYSLGSNAAAKAAGGDAPMRAMTGVGTVKVGSGGGVENP